MGISGDFRVNPNFIYPIAKKIEELEQYKKLIQKLKENKGLNNKLPELNYKDLLPYVKIKHNELKQLFEDIYKKKIIWKERYNIKKK